MTLPRHITSHAIQRYQERVENLSADEVRARLSTPTIMAAVGLGVCSVRLPTGQRVVVHEGRIVTVVPKPIRRCRRQMREFDE